MRALSHSRAQKMSRQVQTRDHKGGKMHISSKTVASLDELLTAASDEQVSRIVVCGTIADAPSIRLSRGQQLVGENENAHILFRPDVDGLEITSDNEVRTIRLQAAPHQR